jgi:hypothetical protein
MANLVFFIAVPILLLLALLVLVSKNPRKGSRHTLTINDFLPVHDHQFEQVDRRLAEYEEMLRKIQSERREFALKYLAELRADFEHVAELLSRAAKFLPEITLGAESERFWVGIRFRLEYRLVQLQIRLGVVPVGHLKALTAKVRFLARSADQFLNEIAREHGLRILESDLNR